ncbi:uncharacterized protein E5676_scaffold443G00520 [Cucumis melo var. makuwa]|uniref:Uncharacterized protein n=1 Tax=Cucumis melo var. makuwa TaxID=1194695 RepID=A0A5D3D7A5_CUCMM|nr:uncharacterized protein E5676_scaffold443G00520 [Cucumis melo var. makuwa]
MSRSALIKLPVDPSYLKPSTVVVRAFDDARREVMDVNSSYSCLLKRPWIHSVGVVSSSLHQRVKFSVECGQAIVYGEDMFVTKTSTSSYVEAVKEALECSYRSFEVANATIFSTEGLYLVHYLSKTSTLFAKTMIRSGFQLHRGLGKDQGNPKVFFLPRAKKRFRYPTIVELEKVRVKKREK